MMNWQEVVFLNLSAVVLDSTYIILQWHRIGSYFVIETVVF